MNYFPLLILLFFLVSCTPLQSSKRAMTPSEIDIKTDLIALENRINLPKNVIDAKWLVLQKGDINRDVPGPSDTALYAILRSRNADWSSLPEAKQLLASQKVVRIPVQIAEKLFPPEVLQNLYPVDGYLEVRGKQYEPNFFRKGSYHGVYAILVQDALLICLQSM